ncbi:hypothetical protein [Clostridium lacusfryxellense]|uniref:hypothetical protein n=1 Tax=Clostridium lacusfryxellense TaxID=205328 RepID=UPI001C0C6C08|nr:hypothetical protein [Clostridium lacusfryxellense]MBU3111994.1 hypothetical protein [Clostridium lacusfryxellense]
MLGKIDCKNMFKDNDNHLCCVHTGKHCNFRKGENNGMRCGSYNAKIIREPIKMRVPQVGEFEDLSLEIVIERKDMQIESLIEFSKNLKKENLRLKADREELILDLINKRNDHFRGDDVYETLYDIISKLEGRE